MGIKENFKDRIGVFPYLFILLAAALAYMPTFSGDFILDDNILVKNNPYIRESHSIYSYLSQEDGIVDERDLGIYHTGYYRPLVNIIYFLDYKIWGTKASGFRTTNFILHFLTCIVLLQIIKQINGNKNVAFWCVLIFALHPVNTETVSVVVSRNNILVTFFILVSFYYYIESWEKDSFSYLILSIIGFIGAAFTKEFGIMLLPVFFAYHRMLSRGNRKLLIEFMSYIPFIMIVIQYFIFRQMVIGTLLTPFDYLELFHRLYFVPYLLVLNLKMVFLPYNLHQYYISYPSRFLDWGVVLSILIILVLIFFLWIKRKEKILVFSSIAFLFLIFPVLSIIPSASTPNALIALRWLYPSMAFLMIGISVLIGKAFRNYKSLTQALLIIVICYFGFYSYILNRNLWHDEDSFLTQEVKHFQNILHSGGLAEKLFDKGEMKEAEKYFLMAINKYPEQAYNYLNYSALLLATGRAVYALEYLEKAKDLVMTHHEQGQWHNNKGTALIYLGKKEEALRFLRQSVLLAPNEPRFLANLGSVYGMLGEYQNSEKVLLKGIDISPEDSQLWINLATTYRNMGDYQKTIDTIERMPSEIKVNNESVLKMLKIAKEKNNAH